MPTKKTRACLRRTTKKYRTRSSPPFSATDCPDQTQTGNDGKSYVSRPDKRGVYRWVLAASASASASASAKPASLPSKKYTTHDNGDRPFVVYDHGNKVTIFPQTYNMDTDAYTTVWTKPKVVTYRTLFVGERGSSVLLETGVGKYTFVGGHMKDFSTPDKDVIRRFSSPIGNSDVPYPTAVGEKYVYFLLDDKYVPQEAMPSLKDDLYSQFYGHGQYANSGVEKQAKKLPGVRIYPKNT